MKIFDISMKIDSRMPVYKNKQENKPVFKVVRNDKNNYAYETGVDMHMHTGTHIDAPLHMVKDGKRIGQLDLNRLVTDCRVLDFTAADTCITKEDLETKKIQPGDFILLKTKNSYQDAFDFDFVFLEKSGAEYLSKKKVIGVGIDALGIERNQPRHETHAALLKNQIVVLEGLRLKDIKEGDYFLFAVPINVYDAEAAPVRAVLLQKNPAG